MRSFIFSGSIPMSAFKCRYHKAGEDRHFNLTEHPSLLLLLDSYRFRYSDLWQEWRLSSTIGQRVKRSFVNFIVGVCRSVFEWSVIPFFKRQWVFLPSWFNKDWKARGYGQPWGRVDTLAVYWQAQSWVLPLLRWDQRDSWRRFLHD
jgi:hypothetical protein